MGTNRLRCNQNRRKKGNRSKKPVKKVKVLGKPVKGPKKPKVVEEGTLEERREAFRRRLLAERNK